MNPPLPVLAVLFVFNMTFAQVQNYSYTDCDGFTESVYDIIGQGKPLLIASKGLDCSICMGQAPDVQAFAEAHPEVRVWGAMNYKYSTNLPTCTGVNDWENTYAWSSIFMFPDVNDQWQGLSYPTYYVISPVDSLIQYQGPSFNLASLLALDLAPTGIVNRKSGKVVFYYDAAANAVHIKTGASVKWQTFLLFNASGQLIFQDDSQNEVNNAVIALPENLTTGIYFSVLRDKQGKTSSAKIVVQR